MSYPVAVIGAGPAGAGYIRHLQRDHRLTVVGFTNRSEARRQEVAEELKLPGFANLAQLLAESPAASGRDYCHG